MGGRNKDNKERKSPSANHTTSSNNEHDGDCTWSVSVNKDLLKIKRNSLEVVEVEANDGHVYSETMKEGVDMQPLLEQQEGNPSPTHRKKVKQTKQRSKLDLNIFHPPPSSDLSPHTHTSPQIVNFDTLNNTNIPINRTNMMPSNTSPTSIRYSTVPTSTETATKTSPTTHTTNLTINTPPATTTNISINSADSATTFTNIQPVSNANIKPEAATTKTKDGGRGAGGEGSTQQKDKMQKLSFLTDLYDQGYITVVEYKERKSQIIDELTGTRTRTRNASHVIMLPPTVVASPPPDWSTIREETALRHVFDTEKNKWSTTVVKVKVDKDPFACGGLRKCYHLHDCTRPEDNYVAKLSIDPFEDHQIYFIDVEIQMQSKEFARKFNLYNPPKNVDFVMAWLLELIEREGRPLCGVETFIEGPYRKHNNNFGYVSEDERNTPQAFSHFTYEASNHKILICDIQGVADLYTDPQMHTIDNRKAELMGKGNMGVRGISKFLSTHQCNAICSERYQKVDVVNIECYHPSPHLFGDKDARSPLLDPPDTNPTARRTCTCTIL